MVLDVVAAFANAVGDPDRRLDVFVAGEPAGSSCSSFDHSAPASRAAAARAEIRLALVEFDLDGVVGLVDRRVERGSIAL